MTDYTGNAAILTHQVDEFGIDAPPWKPSTGTLLVYAEHGCIVAAQIADPGPANGGLR